MLTIRYTYEILLETAKYLFDRVSFKPKVGIICGSGLGRLASGLENSIEFPYQTIPHFPVSTVEGHIGQLVFGYLSGTPVVCMQGRFHYYEGYPLWECAMPVRVMKLLGISHLIASNAAEGLNPKYNVGDIMIIKDHTDPMGFSGNNPLQVPNEDRFGPRFLSMTEAYNNQLIDYAHEIGTKLKIEKLLHEGTYTCVGGPNFETVAELKMLNILGVDAVGMSTVDEIITAKHCDLIVFAFSLITNICIASYDSQANSNHVEVLGLGKKREIVLRKFVEEMIQKIGVNGNE